MNNKAKVLKFMKDSGPTTVAEVANKIGITRRSVFRHVAALRDEGHRIQGCPGQGGGIWLRK